MLRAAHIVLIVSAVLIVVVATPASCGSPIPTFDKEAVTDYPYMRTGDPEIQVEENEVLPSGAGSKSHSGNTGTEEDPAFFIREIKLTGYRVLDKKGELAKILDGYSGRSVRVRELPLLRNDIATYCRGTGYTIPLAVIPAQEVKDGVLEVRIYVAVYDDVQITVNSSDIYDKTLNRYISYLRKGDVITERRLETAVNNLNDLPGVQARAVLRPGSKPGTTAIDIEVQKRKVWNNYVFADNGGGYYSGRYRFGFNTEINNPSRTGDKIIASGLITDEDTKNYSVRYETPLGYRGTRVGIAFSQTNYEFSPNALYDTLGESRGLSLYGMTPIYRDKSDRVTLIYGYDRREITDEYRFREDVFRPYNFGRDKTADVWHIGFSGSSYLPNQFLQYSLVYWYGDIHTDGGGAYYDGCYHKLTADLLKI